MGRGTRGVWGSGAGAESSLSAFFGAMAAMRATRSGLAGGAVLVGAAVLAASFLLNVALVHMASPVLRVGADWKEGPNVTYRAYHVAMEPGDTLIIPPNPFTGKFVYLDVVEGGEAEHVIQGRPAPNTYLRVEPPEYYSRWEGGRPPSGQGVSVDLREYVRLTRPEPPAEPTVALTDPDGTPRGRWGANDRDGLDVVFWIPTDASPAGPRNHTKQLLLQAQDPLSGGGPEAFQVVRPWLLPAQRVLYAVDGLALVLMAVGTVASLARRGRSEAPPGVDASAAAGLDAYVALARRAEEYVRSLRGLLGAVGVTLLFLGAFAAVAVMGVFGELRYSHPDAAWRPFLGVSLLLGYALLLAAWAVQLVRVQRELRRLRRTQPPAFPE